ncbi:mandelate racemase/muconate lactonizing protein [Pusillimonas sp. T7-7]|uniref:mandelate racemase/muconate lactonizing enzyme family protein n=1 Tax=Pusillimonas sp. (strain T7-7) TaxID=1007105 RepID=UPI00020855B7|nr:mandelate racemase/muconate lactonizing enzyme family protein [Pusillimonas sp. T7-7]AEC21959.1 mandelate racemase/muconate lactonizing protein [Pusillimonas sp. T7-7]
MKIERVETLACDAGWRNYNFLKITTDTGIVGWSEFDEAFGPAGLGDVIKRYAPQLIGKSVNDHEMLYGSIAATMRPAPHGLSAEALGAIENALLDAKAKSLGVPCYQLLGGKHRDSIPIYWSHCATWRIGHPTYYKPAIVDLDGVKKAGEDARLAGHSAVKTNMFVHGDGKLRQWMAGFGAPYAPSLNIDKKLINSVCAHLEALRDGTGPDVRLMIDLNFNARTEGYVSMIRALKDFDFLWVELDSYNPEALAYIRQQSHCPISGLETLFGVRQFLPYFRQQSVDVAIIDAVWNGVWQSMKIANTAEAFDVNIAPHNFYSHLASMMNVHFAAAVPNLRIMEYDIDRLPWDDELFNYAPKVSNGEILVPDAPGWGCEPNEEAFLAHPPKERNGYLGL